jgi:2-polyprenyl-3-methyl-5-hydroxy-6-metoxy-1,4-benzoquinol methylase
MPQTPDSSSSDATLFDARAASWDENAARKARSQEISRAFGAIIDARGDWPDLLDYGCGTGQTCLPLADKCASVTGCDFSAEMLEKFVANAAESGASNARTLQCDLSTDTLPAAGYDMVTSSMTLHHIAEVAYLVEKLALLLRPGGTIALVDLETEDGTFHDDNTGVKHYGFEKAQIVDFLKALGFADVRARTLLKIPRERSGKLREYPVFIAQGTRPK